MATFDLFRNKNLSNDKRFHRNNSDDTLHTICLKNGILTATLLIISFIVFCGYTHQFEIHQLSVVNMLLLGLGVYFAIHRLSETGKADSVDYFEGFKVGIYTSIVAVGIHALFLLVYTFIDSSVLTEIKSGHIYGIILNPLTIAGVTFFEGLASALVITFCFMQYFKKNDI